MAKNELSELGEESDEYVESTSKMRQEIEAVTGFDIMKNENEYKDLYDIMVGIGEKWQDLTDIQRAALGEKIAGKIQSNAFFSIMNNIDTLKEAYQTALTSEGSAQTAQDVYATTVQYSIDRLKASWQEFSNDFLSSDFLKRVVDFGNAAVKTLDSISNAIGSLGMTFTGSVLFDLLKGKITGRGFLKKSFVDAVGKVGLSDSGGVFKNIAAIFKQGAQKANIGAEIADVATGQIAKLNVGTQIVKVTADQIARAGVGVDVPVNGFMKALSGDVIDVTDDVAKSLNIVGGAGTYAINEAGEAVAVLTNNLDGVVPAAKGAGGALAGIFNVLSSNPLFSIGIAAALGFTIYKIVDYVNKAGERAKEQMSESVAEYQESQSKLDDINSRLEQTSNSIKELKSKGPLTLVEKGQLQELERVNEQLERQKKIQEFTTQNDKKASLKDTREAFNLNYGGQVFSASAVNATYKDYMAQLNRVREQDEAAINPFISVPAKKTVDILGAQYIFFTSELEKKYKELDEAADEDKDHIQEVIEGLTNYQSDTLSDIVAMSKDLAVFEDAFEGIDIESLSKEDRDIYDTIIKAQDFLLSITDPEAWQINKIEEFLTSDGNKSIGNILSDQINKIIKSNPDASPDAILKEAQGLLQYQYGERGELLNPFPELSGDVFSEFLAGLTQLGLTTDDLIEHLVNHAIEGAKEASNYVEQDFDKAAERTTSLITGIQKIQVDSLNRSPAESVSFEDYQLVMDTPALYDYAEAFEVVNGVMTVNRDKWKEITEAKLESERVNLEGEKKAAQDRLAQYKTDLQDLGTQILSSASPEATQALGDAYKQTQDNIDETEREIKGYDLLIQTLGEGADAYHTFVAAQSAATSGEMFTKASEAYQALYDIFDPNSDTFGMSGAGNPVYEAAIEFVIPDYVREQGENAIKNYLDSMQKYMQTDANGKITWELDLTKFATELENRSATLGLGPLSPEHLISEEGVDLRKDVADAMHITEDALRAMLGELMQYGSNIDEIMTNLNFKNAIDGSDALISNISTIDGMLGKTLGASDIKSLFEDESLKKYADALEVVNGQLRLNIEEVKNLREAEIEERKTKNEGIIQDYQAEWDERHQNGLDETKRSKWLQERINELETYNQIIDATSTKFADFQLAQQIGDQGSVLFKSTTEAFQTIRDAFDETSESFGKKGLVYEQAIQLVIPESVRDQGEQAIKNFANDMAKFWREDVDGKLTGELDFAKLQEAISSIDVSMSLGEIIDNENLTHIFANAIGVSFEGAQSIIGMLMDYGITSFSELDALAEQMNFKTAVEDTTKLTSNLQTIGSIISNISSGKALSFDEITSLFESDQLKEYLAALEVVNGQMVLNPQTVRDIRANQIGKQVNVNEALIQSYQKQPASDINTERITRLRLYNQALKESTSAYNAWVEGQSQEVSTTFMDNSLAAIQKINEVFTRTSETFGMVGQGNQAYQLAVDVILPEELDRTDTRTVKNYIDSLGDMIDKDLNGEIKGIKISAAIKKALDKGLLQQRNGLYDFGRNTIEDIAKGMNVSNDIARALVQYMNAFGNKAAEINMSNLVSDFESATSDASQLLDQMGSLETILSGQTVGKSLSFEDFKTLYDTPSLQKYIGALEAYNGELRLNADMVREIAKAEGEDQIRQNTAEKNKLMKDYADNLKRVNELQAKGKNISTSELAELNGLQAQNDLIVAQCRGYDLLSENIRDATGAYQNWLNMKNADNSDKMFNEATEAANALRDAFKTDKTGKGNLQYQAALEFLIPDTIDPKDTAAVEKYWNDIKGKIFKTNDKGEFEGFNLKGFLDYAKSKGLMEQVGNQYRLVGAMSMEEFAEGANMRLELVQAIFGELDMYENTFSWTDPDQFDGLLSQAETAANAINELHPEMDLQVDFSEIEGVPKQINAIDKEIQKVSDYQATLQVDTKEWSDAQTYLNYLEVLKAQLETPAILTIDVSNAAPEVQYGVDLIQRIITAQETLNLLESTPNVDPSLIQAAEEDLVNLQEEMNTTDGQEALVSVGIEGATTIEDVYNQSGTATVNIGLGTNTAQSEIDKMNQEKVDIQVNVNDEETQGKIDVLENRLNTINTTEYQVNVIANTDEADKAIQDIEDAEINDKEFDIVGDASRATQAINFINNKSKVNDKQFKITAQLLALESINRLKNELNKLQGKTIEIKTVYKTVGKPANASDLASGTAHVSGTAHASGTARPKPYTIKDLTGEAKLQGDWGMSEGKRVLIGELGPEIVVDPKSGRWRTYGDMGAEFAYIPKNAIVFNHLQTKDLLSKGFVNARGKAMASGTALANPKQEVVGGITVPSSSGGKSGTTSSSSGGKSGSDKSSSNSSDKEPTKIDWIETLLSRIQRLFDNFKNLAEYYTTFTYQNKELQRAVVQAQQNVNKQQQAANKYYELAQSKAGDYWEKIKNGTIQIENISNEETAKAVQEAKDLYEKYLQCTDQVVELRKELLELARTKLDNIVDDYDSLNGYAEQYISLLDAQIERRDTMGGQTDILKRNQQDIDQLKQMADYYNDIKTAASDYAATYQGQITDNLAKGFYKIGSQEWIDAKTQLYDLQTQAYEAATSVEELNERIRELNWYSFNEGIAIIEHIDKQLGNTIDLIKDLEVYSDKTAAVNENGISQFNLYASALASARQQVADYRVAIKALDGELASGMITQDKYNEELRDYREKQMDAVKSVKSYRDAIIDLVKKGIQAETKAMSDLISKRKEDLKKQKEANDYAKKISDKTKEINKIKAQITALSGDTTAATQAKIKQLQADLAKQEEELAETRMDHEYDMRTKAMDDELDRFKEIQEAKTTELETSLDAQEKAIAETLAWTSTQYGQITDELTKLAEMYGVQLEDFVVNPWKDATAALEEYKKAVETTPDTTVSIETDNAVHKNNHSGTSGQSTLVESGTDGGSSNDPFGKGGPNFTTTDSTQSEKIAQDIGRSTSGTSNANQKYVVSGNNGVNFRKNSSFEADIIQKLNKGDQLVATGNTRTLDGNVWREVTYNGQKGWVVESYLSKYQEPAKTTTTTTQPKTTTTTTTPATTASSQTKYKVTASNNLNLRADAGTDKTILASIPNGTEIVGAGQTKNVSGTTWYQVSYNGKTGWVSGQYLSKVTSGSTTSASSGTNTYKLTSAYYFRKTPNGDKLIDKALPTGTAVEFTGTTSNGWWQVKYNGMTGWIYNGSGALKKAARGARVASGLYLTDEEGIGSEAIITKKGVLRQLDSATVFSKEQTDRLWKLSKSDLLENIKPSAFAGGISLSYGSLLTVNGNVDRDALPGLQDLLKQACEYTKRDLKQNLMKMGMR